MTIAERLMDIRLADIRGTNIILHIRDSKNTSPVFFECASSTEALDFIYKVFGSPVFKDEKASLNAGYPVYTGSFNNESFWVSDLGNRWELNTQHGESFNFWYA